MNYKFAVIENCDATCWDERIGGFKTCESIIVIDVPPQKRLISFINSCETLEFFISLPRMHFYSYIYGEKKRYYSHAVFFVDDENNYFYPALPNIDIQVCGLSGDDEKNKMANIEIALNNLDRFYSTSFTCDLSDCLRLYIKKYSESSRKLFRKTGRINENHNHIGNNNSLQFPYNVHSINHIIDFFSEWSAVTIKGEDFISSMIPFSGTANFKKNLKFNYKKELNCKL
jgi:hypothetical protein